MEEKSFSQFADSIARQNQELNSLTDKEKEIALKILNDLGGTTVIRANSILDFCKTAIQYSTIN